MDNREEEVGVLLRQLIAEIKMLSEAVVQNTGATERLAYWTAQSFRGKDSAGNPG